jgi:hypothetical protein
MGRRAEVALYRIYATEKSHQYVRIVRSGRGWAPNTEAVGKPGSLLLPIVKIGTEQREGSTAFIFGGGSNCEYTPIHLTAISLRALLAED